jgi:hypothetical protein
MKIDRTKHIETGLQIRIVLASCYDFIYRPYAKYIVPGSIHTIVDRPSRKARRNGDMGVWVEGTDDEKVFVRFFGWLPYVQKKSMQKTEFAFTRTKYAFTRTKFAFERTKLPIMKRTK